MQIIKKIQLTKITKLYITILFSILITQILLRVFEFLYLESIYAAGYRENLFIQAKGLTYDLSLWLIIGIFLILPLTFLFYHILKKRILIIAYVCITLFSFIHLSLLGYFKQTLIPLDAVILHYTPEEIKFIIQSNSSGNLLFLIPVLLITAIGITLLSSYLVKKIKSNHKVVLVFIILISIFMVLARKQIKPSISNFNTPTKYYLTINKTFYFFNKLRVELHNSKISKLYNGRDIKKNAERIWTQHPENKYLKSNYPFYRKFESNNVLSPYFKLQKEPPNIVLIMVESLGKELTGEGKFNGFTPFIDSLSKVSLTWDNFASSSSRTFGFLPAATGSLPYGRNGFMAYKDVMPVHTSLISILKQKGYFTSYFYGSDAHFDNMYTYLKRNDIDYILQNFYGFPKMPANSDGYCWGYGDQVLFKCSLEVKDSIPRQPFFDIYMTLSTHSPWMVNNQAYYQQKVYEIIKNHDGLTSSIEAYERHPEELSCLLYSDDALKKYFNEIKNKDWYSNTIFIITGDHRFSIFEAESEIKNYHVPLLIFSPLLKKAKVFKGVSTHNNLPATLLSLLENHIELPTKVSFTENVLDTSTIFRSGQIHPLIQVDRNTNQLIFNEYYLNNKQLYIIEDNLALTPCSNTTIKNKLTKYLNSYNYCSIFSCENNRIMPFKDYLESRAYQILKTKSLNFEDYINKSNETIIYDTIIKSHVIKIDKNRTYYNLVNKLFIDKSCQKIEVHSSMLFKQKNKKELKLIYSIKNNKNETLLWDYDFINDPTINAHGFKAANYQNKSLLKHVEMKNLHQSTDSLYLYVYIYNPGLEFFLDDVEVSVIKDKERSNKNSNY